MRLAEKPNILVVEDNFENVLYLESVMKTFNINIIKAYSGREALEKIKGHELALALIDIQMPEMDGIELASIIQADKSRDIVPIIFITAFFQNELQLEKCYESGAVDFIQKPIKSTILKSKIKVFLELYRQKHLIYESEVKYHSIVEQSFQGVVVLQDLKIVFANSAYVKMSGYSLDELQAMDGNQVRGLFFPKDRSLPWRNVSEEEFEKTLLTTTEFQGIEKTGEPKWLNVYANRVDFRGNPALQLVTIDMTHQIQMEEELKNIFDLSTDLIGIIDLDHLRIKKINPAFERILGYSEAEFLGHSMLDFIHPDDRERTLQIFQTELKQGREALNYENRWQCRSGEFRWMNWGSQPVVEKGIVYSIANDITNKKLAEQALRESETMYRTLLNASPEGIVIMDVQGGITELSDIAMEIFGISRKNDFLGKPFLGFIPPDCVPQVQSGIERTLNESLVQNLEVILNRADQSQFIAEISMTLIKAADGSPKSLMAIVRDVTQRKAMEKQLNHSERMAVLGEMATGIAHEINQPLNTLSLSLENILLEIKTKKKIDQEYLNNKSERIFGNIYRIGNIIDHIRAFSRDHNDYIRSSFSVNESIRNALSMISEQFRNKGIDLKIVLSEDVQVVLGNTYKFEQVVLNLLINAKDAIEEKAKEEGGDYRKIIEICTIQDQNGLKIEVTDNGIGIKPEVLDKIMLPFFTTKDTGKGTGLGLSLSFGIIKEMGGVLELSSVFHQGTTARINFPQPA